MRATFGVALVTLFLVSTARAAPILMMHVEGQVRRFDDRPEGLPDRVNVSLGASGGSASAPMPREVGASARADLRVSPYANTFRRANSSLTHPAWANIGTAGVTFDGWSLRKEDLLLDSAGSLVNGTQWTATTFVERGSPNVLTGTGLHMLYVDGRVTSAEHSVTVREECCVQGQVFTTYLHDYLTGFEIDLYGGLGEIPEPATLPLFIVGVVAIAYRTGRR